MKHGESTEYSACVLLCLQTNHQISFHYNHHHHHNNNNNDNNSLEQPTPSKCHSFIPGRPELNKRRPLRQPQIVIEAVQGVRIDSIAALGIQTGNISPGLETHHQPHLWTVGTCGDQDPAVELTMSAHDVHVKHPEYT